MKFKNIIREIKKEQNILMFMIAFAVFVYGIYLFWSGFHSFDMSQNLIFIRDDISIDLLKQNINFSIETYLETTTKGDVYTLEQTYVNGVKKILLSINIMIVSMFGIGYYFSRIERGDKP